MEARTDNIGGHMHGKQAVVDLYDEYIECQKCPMLCSSRTQVVFGSGSVTADIMIIGEAPGPEEDEEGVPFSGKSGRLLFQLLDRVWEPSERLAEIRQIEDNQEYFRQLRGFLEDRIFFTNVVLCMPGDNRSPSTQEIKNCKDRLAKTIYAVDPKLIIAAGKTAASVVLGKKISIINRRGELFDISIPSPVTNLPIRYPMMALLHPSYLLRKGDQSLVPKKKGDTYQTLVDLRYALSLFEEYNKQVEKMK